MATLLDQPIPLDPRDGGPLDWFDHLDQDLRVPIAFWGEGYPERQQEAWLIKMLRKDRMQVFFFRPLAHKGLALDFELVSSKAPLWPDHFKTIGRVPLAQLFMLPNVNPAEELAQMKAFLTWLDDRVKGQAPNGADAHIQWYRSGRKSRGLEAAGFVDDVAQEQLKQDLQAWRQTPWFEAWYQANMAGFARTRSNGTLWFSTSSLVADRELARMMEELDTKKAARAPRP